jgi:hypothetical protein
MARPPAATAQQEVFPAAAVVLLAQEVALLPAALEQEDKFGWYHGKQLGNDP